MSNSKNDLKILRFPCGIGGCGESFHTEPFLNRHIQSEHLSREDWIECSIKDCKVFVQVKNLKNHLRKVHNGKRSCEICGKLLNIGSLPAHVERCNSDGIKKFFCSFENCNYAGKTKTNLGSHIYNVHTTKEKCSYSNCNTYTSRRYMQRHIKAVHLKLRKSCPNCGKQQSRLDTHLPKCTKSRVKNFHCTVDGCKSAHAIYEDLSAHIKKVHAKPLKCPYEDCDDLIKPIWFQRHISRKHRN